MQLNRVYISNDIDPSWWDYIVDNIKLLLFIGIIQRKVQIKITTQLFSRISDICIINNNIRQQFHETNLHS